VLPESWGTGVGRALMAETVDRLRSSGFEQAILWMFDDNPRARAFYELAGWHLDGVVKDEEWLGTLAREVRYRLDLVAS
jgi:GNAT superfamily N-acetyltransferase